MADYWNQSGVNCAVTYIVDADAPGKVLKCLPEEYYTWADAGFGNRNLITIEVCESDFMKYSGNGASYTVTDRERFKADILRGYDTAVALCVDICKRYKWDPMSKLSSGLYLISSHNEGRMLGLSSAHVDPSHLWPEVGLSMDTFRQAVKNVMASGGIAYTETEVKYYRVRKNWKDESSQLGAFENVENAIAACPSGYHVYDWNGKNVYTNKCSTTGTQASDFEGLSEGKAAEKILELVKNCDTSGILYSVSAAQMILESGYVTTSLSKSANNCFGMKTILSGNNWDTVWDGVSFVNSLTWEVYNGKTTQIYADFRKYPCIEDSVKDHAAYLLGAMNGNKKRYEGLLKAKDYKEAITIIKNGGYATDPNYISKVCQLVERFSLNRYDVAPKEEKKEKAPAKPKLYAVQVGSYKKKGNAERRVAAVKEAASFDCSIVEDNGMYFVICGQYKSKSNATKRMNKLKKLGVDCFVKET